MSSIQRFRRFQASHGPLFQSSEHFLDDQSINGIKEVQPNQELEDDKCYLIKRVSLLHELLGDTMDDANRCFSLQVMLSIGGCFVFCILSLYSFYRDMISDGKFDAITVIHLVWAFYFCIFVFKTIATGSSTTRTVKTCVLKNNITFIAINHFQGKSTAVIIHKIINRSTNERIISKLMQFSQQLQHRPPVASCGLFPFDWTLSYSVSVSKRPFSFVHFHQISTLSKTDRRSNNHLFDHIDSIRFELSSGCNTQRNNSSSLKLLIIRCQLLE